MHTRLPQHLARIRVAACSQDNAIVATRKILRQRRCKSSQLPSLPCIGPCVDGQTLYGWCHKCPHSLVALVSNILPQNKNSEPLEGTILWRTPEVNSISASECSEFSQFCCSKSKAKECQISMCVSMVVHNNSVPWADPKLQFRRESRCWTISVRILSKRGGPRPLAGVYRTQHHKWLIDGLIQDP